MVFLFMILKVRQLSCQKKYHKKTKQRIRTNNSKNKGKIKIEFGQMKRLCTFTLLGKGAILH